MGYLIDTSLLIAIERGRLTAADIHVITRQQPVYLSPVNFAEIRYGIELMTDARSRQRANAALRRMRRKPLLRINGDTAEVFGVLAAKLNQGGPWCRLPCPRPLACRPGGATRLHGPDRQREGLPGRSRIEMGSRESALMRPGALQMITKATAP